MSIAASPHAPVARPVARPRPDLRLVPPPPRRRRAPRSRPSAAGVAVYALGLLTGFLLAAGASLPGGPGAVAGQLVLAAAAALVAVLALMRSRALARRRVRARRAGFPAPARWDR